MFLAPVLAIIIIRYFRRTLHTDVEAPQWHKILFISLFVSIGLIVVQASLYESRFIAGVAGYAIVFWLAWLTFNKPFFRPARPVIYASLPLMIISCISDIAKLYFNWFAEKWELVFASLTIFSLIWLIAMLIINKRQRTAIEKERQRAKEIERENQITAKLKAELEIQVAERTADLTTQKEALQQTLNELRATQAQLIQSEKMASLGELTAGIAHEIQNPLNFVNNFSEVTNELIAELKEEKSKAAGERNEQVEKELLDDIAQNLEKINHHGKRADGIVKGMLQHSRTSTGQKEPANINVLADEYLRLAYHGLRAKDKSFNATLKTDFDENITDIKIIPQDIGRVILNLITNAFYAVAEKKNKIGSAGTYEPTVTVSTKKINNRIQVKVIDNGMGIPSKVLEKIFQPFFTTKPTGQGTGLGLSMSYDIVSKGHGGELKVETKEGEGSVFIIDLPG